MKASRSKVYHLLNPEQQKYLPKEHLNFHNYYGTVVRKLLGRKAAYDIQFDVFHGGETAVGLQRDVFTTVKKGEEEPPIYRRYLGKLAAEIELMDVEEKTPDEIQTEKEFSKQSHDQLIAANNFTKVFNKKKAPIAWKIHKADEDIEGCHAYKILKEQMNDGPNINPDILMENKRQGEFILDYL